MARLGMHVLAIWMTTALPVLADQVTVHVTGMGVGQRVDHARAIVSDMDFTANTLFHDDPFTVGSIIIRMPENDIREGLTETEFRDAIAKDLRRHVDTHWRAGRREFEIHLLQDNTLLKHAFHELSDIQDDVAKFSRAAYGAIGDVLTDLEGRGHEIAVDASLGSNDTAGFVLAGKAWRPWENMIRRVTLVDGRAPLGAVRDTLDILGGPRVRIVNSQFDAPAAPDWTGVFQNIAFLGNSERLHADYPGLQLLWVRPTEELVATKGHIRTLSKPDESFEVSLYLGDGFYADIGDYTGREIHPRFSLAEYDRFAPTGLPPVGHGRTPIRGPVYDRHASLRIGAEMAFELAETLTLLNDVIQVLSGARETAPLGDLRALAESLARDLQTASPDGSIVVSAETVFAMARLELAVIGVADHGALGFVEGALRLQQSIGDPDGWTLVLDGFSDATAALGGLNPLQVKVVRELGRRATAPGIERLWYEMSGTADKILKQAEHRQRQAVASGAAPLPLDRLLGPAELSVVGFWRRATFDRRWRVRASPRATVTARHSVRRETCVAGRCSSVTLKAGTGRAVGVYSADLKATAVRRSRQAGALATALTPVRTQLMRVRPLRTDAPARRRPVPDEPEALRRARESLLPCIGDGPGCIRIKRPEREVRSCALRGDCPPPRNDWPFFMKRPGGLAGPAFSGDDGPGGSGGPFDDDGQDRGGVFIAPVFTAAPPRTDGDDIRALLSKCDFSASAACDLSP